MIIDADLEQHGRTDKYDERQYDGGDGDRDPCTRAMNDPCVTATIYTRPLPTRVHGYTQGEVTSQSLWSRYDRHFVGITPRNALS